MNNKVKYVTISVPEGSFICPVGDTKRRIKAAEDYLKSCDRLTDTEDKYEPWGYHNEDVMKAIEIAAGKSRDE